ncbi:hypothetical protein ACIQCR_35095 [Streptomyces sp. NPDC093249]|uniref:hypothetical protein n=1 Tax=unclassified Streptomyces TaxID=2593676 RepID=UPI00381C0664
MSAAASEGSGDRELAASVYERIEQRLSRLSPGNGERVTITLDDRVAPEPDTDGDRQDGETGTQSGWGA